MPLRVLFVARWYPSYDDPGRGIFVADQAAALRAAGVDVVVASFEFVRLRYPSSPPGDRTHSAMSVWAEAIAADPWLAEPRSWGAAGIPVARLPAAAPNKGAGPRDPLELAASEAETLVAFGTALARRWPFDLIHAHTGLPDGFAAAQLADRLHLPMVVTEHESGLASRLATEPARAAYRSLFGPDRRVLAVSATLARQMTDLLGPATPSVAVIPNAVDVGAFGPGRPVERDPDELLWVGSRQASKGTDELLEAFTLLQKERPTLRLRLIGRAPAGEDVRLSAHARALGIGGAVSFEPPGDRVTVAAAMARAGLFVHPSPRETFGVVAVEALASGLPVVAAPSGGVEEILGADGEFGEIAASPVAADLAAAVGRALDRRGDFEPAVMRAHATSRYAADAVASLILDLYGSLAVAAIPADRPAPSPSVTTFDRPLLVGLRRETAMRQLATLPPELAASLAIVTSVAGRPSAQAAPTAVVPGGVDGATTVESTEAAGTIEVAALFEVDPDASFRAAMRALGGPAVSRSLPGRLRAAARHPVLAFRVWRSAGQRVGSRLAAQRDVIAAALDATTREGRPTRILPLDVDDLPVLEPFLGEGVRLYPAALRGLVDRWDEAGRPGPEPGPRASLSGVAAPAVQPAGSVPSGEAA